MSRLTLVCAAVLGVLAAVAVVPTSNAATGAVTCPSQLRGLVNALVVIEGNLDSGISFNQYSALLTRANIAYDGIPVNAESRSCVNYVGVPAERAINYYIRAKNAWAQCVRTATAASCIERGDLNYNAEQIDWANAGANISRAINSLG